MHHWVYVLRCGDGSLYTGYTTDVPRRLATHLAGSGAKYTRGRGPLRLMATWSYPDKRSAMQAEYRFKQLTRRQKLLHLATIPADAKEPDLHRPGSCKTTV